MIKKEDVKLLFERLPLSERKMPVMVIDGKTLTWEDIWISVRDKTGISDKVIKKLNQIIKKIQKIEPKK